MPNGRLVTRHGWFRSARKGFPPTTTTLSLRFSFAAPKRVWWRVSWYCRAIAASPCSRRFVFRRLELPSHAVEAVVTVLILNRTPGATAEPAQRLTMTSSKSEHHETSLQSVNLNYVLCVGNCANVPIKFYVPKLMWNVTTRTINDNENSEERKNYYYYYYSY